MCQSRITENQLAEAVVKLLPELGGQATIARLRRELPQYIALNDNDRALSHTRSGAQMWEQQLRNIVCHRGCPDNYVNRGFLAYRRNRLVLPANDAPLLDMMRI